MVGPLYHGSPHTFDKFDVSKIGTGEGAQAYGHGLYFAENPRVAQEYRVHLSSGRQYRGNSAYLTAANDFKNHGYSLDDAREGMRQAYRHASQNELDDALREVYGNPKGAVYKVELPKADADDFLDWDRPLSQQSEKVRKAVEQLRVLPHARGPEWERYYHELAKATGGANAKYDEAMDIARGMISGRIPSTGEESMASWARLQQLAPDVDHNAIHAVADNMRKAGLDADATGETIYGYLTNRHSRETASQLLSAHGIKGVRYLDQGSRGTGKGTSNYVVFDDKDIEVLERGGINANLALKMLGLTGAGAAAGLTAGGLVAGRDRP